MTSYLTTSEERDAFLRWLEEQKDRHRPIGPRPVLRRSESPYTYEKADSCRAYEHLQGSYEAFLAVLAYVKTGGKL